MKTVSVILKGNIQKVGYRAKIIDIASRLGINGEIENHNDMSVRIIAQSSDEDKIKEFVRQVNIKNTLIRVDNVSVEPLDTDKIYTDFKKVVKAKETDERLDSAVDHLKKLIEVTKEGVGYSKQSAEYSKQSVEYSKQSVELTKQNLELTKYGIDENKKGFSSITKEIREGNDKLSGKLDVIHKDLSVNLKSFHHDTVVRFDIVDAKYGLISKNMEKIFYEMKEERIETRKTMKELIGAVLKVAEKK